MGSIPVAGAMYNRTRLKPCPVIHNILIRIEPLKCKAFERTCVDDKKQTMHKVARRGSDSRWECHEKRCSYLIFKCFCNAFLLSIFRIWISM